MIRPTALTKSPLNLWKIAVRKEGLYEKVLWLVQESGFTVDQEILLLLFSFFIPNWLERFPYSSSCILFLQSPNVLLDDLALGADLQQTWCLRVEYGVVHIIAHNRTSNILFLRLQSLYEMSISSTVATSTNFFRTCLVFLQDAGSVTWIDELRHVCFQPLVNNLINKSRSICFIPSFSKPRHVML